MITYKFVRKYIKSKDRLHLKRLHHRIKPSSNHPLDSLVRWYHDHVPKEGNKSLSTKAVYDLFCVITSNEASRKYFKDFPILAPQYLTTLFESRNFVTYTLLEALDDKMFADEVFHRYQMLINMGFKNIHALTHHDKSDMLNITAILTAIESSANPVITDDVLKGLNKISRLQLNVMVNRYHTDLLSELLIKNNIKCYIDTMHKILLCKRRMMINIEEQRIILRHPHIEILLRAVEILGENYLLSDAAFEKLITSDDPIKIALALHYLGAPQHSNDEAIVLRSKNPREMVDILTSQYRERVVGYFEILEKSPSPLRTAAAISQLRGLTDELHLIDFNKLILQKDISNCMRKLCVLIQEKAFTKENIDLILSSNLGVGRMRLFSTVKTTITTSTTEGKMPCPVTMNLLTSNKL